MSWTKNLDLTLKFDKREYSIICLNKTAQYSKLYFRFLYTATKNKTWVFSVKLYLVTALIIRLFLDPNFSWTQFFLTNKYLLTNFFLDQKFVEPKKNCWTQDFFWSRVIWMELALDLYVNLCMWCPHQIRLSLYY